MATSEGPEILLSAQRNGQRLIINKERSIYSNEEYSFPAPILGLLPCQGC